MNARRIDRGILHIGRQRSDVIDAGLVNELADLLESDINLAASDHRADPAAGRNLLHFRFDLVGDAHAFDYADDVGPAWAGRIANRLRRQQSALQGRARTDVRLGRAGAYTRADTRLHQVDAGAGRELAVLDKAVDRRGADNDDVIHFASSKLLVDPSST